MQQKGLLQHIRRNIWMHSLFKDFALDYFKRSTRVAAFSNIDGAGRFLNGLHVFQVLGEWGRMSKPCAVVLLKWTNGQKKYSCYVSSSTLRNILRGFLALEALESNTFNWALDRETNLAFLPTATTKVSQDYRKAVNRISSVKILESYYFLVDSWLIDSATHLQLIIFLCFQLTLSPLLIKPNQFPFICAWLIIGRLGWSKPRLIPFFISKSSVYP